MLVKWVILEDQDLVKLMYLDGGVVYVTKGDFDRSFSEIARASRSEAIRIFAV